MNIVDMIDNYINEITRIEQLKTSAQKAKARKIEQRGDSNAAKTNFKHRQDLKKDVVKHAEKKVDYYEKEQDIREKDKKKKESKPIGLLRMFRR